MGYLRLRIRILGGLLGGTPLLDFEGFILGHDGEYFFILD